MVSSNCCFWKSIKGVFANSRYAEAAGNCTTFCGTKHSKLENSIFNKIFCGEITHQEFIIHIVDAYLQYQSLRRLGRNN